MPDTDCVYRVRQESVGVVPENEGRVSLVLAGPYAAIGTARAEATRRKNRAKRDPYWAHEITVERATGWETV